MYKYFTKGAIILGSFLFIAKCFYKTSNAIVPPSNKPLAISLPSKDPIDLNKEGSNEKIGATERVTVGKEKLRTIKELAQTELKKPFPEINFHHIVRAYQDIIGAFEGITDAYEEITEIVTETKNALTAFHNQYRQRETKHLEENPQPNPN
jgi:hypothetical protein